MWNGIATDHAKGGHSHVRSVRTIADLEGTNLIDTPHIAEALLFRKRERD